MSILNQAISLFAFKCSHMQALLHKTEQAHNPLMPSCATTPAAFLVALEDGGLLLAEIPAAQVGRQHRHRSGHQDACSKQP